MAVSRSKIRTAKKIRSKIDYPDDVLAMTMVNELELTKVKIYHHHPQNLTEKERLGLEELCDNHDIKIKPADKGSAIVIQNTKDYIKEAERQLVDEMFYKPLPTNPTDKHNNIIKKRINGFLDSGEITRTLMIIC